MKFKIVQKRKRRNNPPSAWLPKGEFLSVTHGASPFLTLTTRLTPRSKDIIRLQVKYADTGQKLTASVDLFGYLLKV